VRDLAFLLPLIFSAAGLCLETQLLTPRDLSKRVPMKLITNFGNLPVSVRTPDFLITTSTKTPLFRLHGQDKNGRPWQVLLRDAARGAWRSQTSLSEAYYFSGYTGAAGSGPQTWILALSFDAAHQPVPFFVVTHSTIEDFVDFDGRGPEFLEQAYWGSRMQDPGYYVTTLYQRRGPYWYRSDGQHGEHVFPTYEKWSVTWKDRPAEAVPRPSSKWEVRDASNDPATGIHATLLRAEEHLVTVNPEVGCKSVTVGLLVTDSPQGRTIELEPRAESLLPLAGVRSQVVLSGLYHWPEGGECDAEILWARR
jgi:hypothetical protein